MHFRKILLALTLLFSYYEGFSQTSKSGFDTTYVELHPELINIRLYLSTKFTNLAVNVPGENRSFLFRPNSGLNLGVGFTYQNFSLNIAAPVGFLNPERIDNWPLYLDLQAHAYPKGMIVDFFGQFYKGYSLDRKFLKDSGEDYLREDIGLVSIGVNYNYLFNGDQLSLTAAFNQSAIQKKSAYSPFVGFEIYGGGIRADSLLIPANENLDYLNFDRSGYFQMGPNAGMAGTLVLGKGFFLTAVGSANLSVGYAKWENDTEFKKWGVVPTYFVRTFFGYNDRRFSINANAVYKNLNLVRGGAYDQALNTGNIRFNIIYKLKAGTKLEKGFSKVNPMRLLKKD